MIMICIQYVACMFCGLSVEHHPTVPSSAQCLVAVPRVEATSKTPQMVDD